MSRIKGITIELEGKTTGLQKALSDVDKQSRSLQNELKQVDRLLKFDPKNTELIAQRQKILADQVESTRERLNRLKAAQEQVQQQFQQGKIGEEQYRAFQREIIQTESKLKHFENQLNATKNKFQELADVTKKAGEGLKKAGDSMTSAGKDLTMKVTAPVAAMGAGIIKAGMDFEATMSKVQALSGATGEELAKLEAQAKELGATTSFSASQAAEGMAFLAMAGWETKDILAGMPGLLDLAASGAMDLGRAADITSNIMSAFSIEASKAGHVADVLAAASSNANTNVEQMGLAMTYLAPVANTLGWTLEEAAAAVMAMSDAGIQGEKAGAAFATSLQRLARPTNEMQKVMKQLNISFFDANGQIKPLPQLVGELEKATKNLTSEQQAAALSTLFGAEAYKNWAVLLEAGSDVLGKNTQMLIEADGAAQKMAETMLDNTKGSIVEFQSALEGLAIQLSDHILPIITKLAQFATELVRRFGELSPTTQKIVLAIAAIAAAIGPLLIVIGSLVGAIGNIVTFIAPLIANLSVLGTAFTALTGPIGIVIAAIAGIIAIGVALYKKWDEISAFLKTCWEGIQNAATSVWTAIKDYFVNVWENIKRIFETVVEIIEKVLRNYWNSIEDDVFVVWDGIKQYFQAWWDLIKNIFVGALLVILQLLTGQWEDAKKSTEQIWQNIKNALSNMWEGIKKIFSGALDAIKGNVQARWESISNIFSNSLEAVKEYVSATWNNIKTSTEQFLTNTHASLKNMFTNMGQSVKNWGIDTLTNIKNSWNQVVSFLKSIDLREIGSQIIQGLINGVKSKAKELVNTVKSSVNDAIKGAKNILGIRSPSRVFMQFGEYTNEGFIKGIEKTSKQLQATVNNVYGSLADSANKSQANQIAYQQIINNSSNIDLSGLIAVITQLANRPVETSINLDGREIANVVSRHQQNDYNLSARMKGVSFT